MPNLGEGTLYSGGQTGQMSNQYALAAKMNQDQVDDVPLWKKNQLKQMQYDPSSNQNGLMDYAYQTRNTQLDNPYGQFGIGSQYNPMGTQWENARRAREAMGSPNNNPYAAEGTQYNVKMGLPGQDLGYKNMEQFYTPQGGVQFRDVSGWTPGSIGYNPFQSFESGLNRISGQLNLNAPASRIGQSGEVLSDEFAPTINVAGQGEFGAQSGWAQANRGIYQQAYKYLIDKYKPTFGSEGAYTFNATNR